MNKKKYIYTHTRYFITPISNKIGILVYYYVETQPTYFIYDNFAGLESKEKALSQYLKIK